MDFDVSRNKILAAIGVFLFVLIAFNEYLAIKVSGNMIMNSGIYLTGDAATDAKTLVFSKGVPEIYGQELNVRYDFDLRDQNVMNAMIARMSVFESGAKKINIDALPADLKKRYVNIGSRIACEFCCGAKTLVFPNGEAACGCAHSSAMRGLALYLLKYHASEFSDDRILQELARWKSLYFPKQMMKKYIEETQAGKFSPDISALMMSAKLGGKKIEGGLPTNFDSLPDMAGGC